MTSNSCDLIPVNRPSLSADDVMEVTRCLETGWIAAGDAVADFEHRWALYCGREFGVAMCNGTVALQAVMEGLQLDGDDEVILPTFTIASCVLAVLRAGAVPVLVDADPVTWTMNVEEVLGAVSRRTRAIMPVHIYGHPVDMDPLLDLSERRGIAIIEDAAEAHGAEYLTGRTGADSRWQRCGGFGLASCFSFFANKLVTSGEGGMVVTDDAVLAERLRGLRNLGFGTVHRFDHALIGHNFRLSNLQAALALHQVDRMGEIVARKRRIASRYAQGLADCITLQLAAEERWARSVFWMYGVVIKDGEGSASELAGRLWDLGVETRPFFRGMHEQRVFREVGLFLSDSHPVSERIADTGLYLPSGLGLTEDEQDRVIDAVHRALPA